MGGSSRELSQLLDSTGGAGEFAATQSVRPCGETRKSSRIHTRREDNIAYVGSIIAARRPGSRAAYENEDGGRKNRRGGRGRGDWAGPVESNRIRGGGAASNDEDIPVIPRNTKSKKRQQVLESQVDVVESTPPPGKNGGTPPDVDEDPSMVQ